MKKQRLIINLFLCSFSLINNIQSQCSASFNYTAGANNTFTFQGFSAPTNSTTNFSWNYGDGNIGNGNLVTHQYSSNGSFTVTLNILTSNPTCSASSSQSIYVGPSPCAINANFTFTMGPGGLVNFSDASTGTTSASTYSWSYGDGNTGTGQSTSNTYTSNGTYNVQYTVYDFNLSCFDTVIIPISINNLPCNINAGFTWSDNNGLVTFYNTTSPQNPSFTYNWNFGDGGASAQNYPSHTYTSTGTYTVSLTATQGSCVSTYSASLTTSITPCLVIANFTYTLGTNGLVTFSNTSTNTYSVYNSWDFGDGGFTYSSNNPAHTYAANGTYNVLLTVSGSPFNCYDSLTIPVTISNVTCNISTGPLYFSGFEGSNGITTFYTNVTNPNMNYSWAFGNGATSALASPTTTYTSPGTYTVTLSVMDPTNSACSASTTDTIQIVYYPCSYNSAFTSTLTLNTLSVTSICTGTSSGVTLVYWSWGDGTYSPGTMNSSTFHTYSINGNYTVSLVIQDSTGNFMNNCYDSSSIAINIGPGSACPVNSNFALQKDTTQLYSWFAYPNYQANIVSALWNWGDGTSSNTLYPSHTYSATGWYNICLTVSLSCGSQSTTCYNSFLNRSLNNAQVFIQVMNTTSSIRTLENPHETINLSPNPTNGEVSVSISGVNSLNPAWLFIYNSLGEIVGRYGIQLSNKLDEKIDLSTLPKGCYLLRIDLSGKSLTKKLIIN